jgi:protein SCO1/2
VIGSNLHFGSRGAACAWFALLLAPIAAPAQATPNTLLQDVGFDQNLGRTIPLDVVLRDETGKQVRLGDFVSTRPVILTLVYYRCPLLCGQELNGLARSLKPLALNPGTNFDLVTLSIDPSETPELAAAKKAAYLEKYGRPGAARGWHFLTGEASSIGQVARAAGFRYVYNPRTKLFAHAAGLVILTPRGQIARYLYGIDYSPKDLQFTLIEASAGRVGSPISRVLLFCYDYDAATGKYTLAILRLIRILGTATALALAAVVVTLIRRERRGALAAPAALDH